MGRFFENLANGNIKSSDTNTTATTDSLSNFDTIIKKLSNRKLKAFELGSGTGIGGISCALVGNDVVLSDKLAHGGKDLWTKVNINNNQNNILKHGSSAKFRDLDWRKLPASKSESSDSDITDLDIIFGSDLFGSWSTDNTGHKFYNAKCPHCGSLADAIAWAGTKSSNVTVVIAYTKRESSDIKDIFQNELKRNGYKIEYTIPSKEIVSNSVHGHSESDSDTDFLFIRKESA